MIEKIRLEIKSRFYVDVAIESVASAQIPSDEKIWTELYMCNKDFVLTELDGLLQNLTIYRDALKNADENALSEALKEGRLCREKFKRRDD